MAIIELYLENDLLELDDNVQIPITKQFEDLTNPTAVKNSFSKTVKIPSTPNNDKIFTYIWRLDHVISTFDPSKRVPFTLVSNSSVFQEGYLKLNNIDFGNDGRPTYYNVNLIGGLGDFFYELSQKDLNELQFPNNLSHVINYTSVLNSFHNFEYFQYNDYMKYCAMYNGFYPNFESDRVYIGPGIGSQPERWKDLSNDRDEWQRHELRSYYQRPGIYVKKMFDAINQGTGYNIILDSDFFSSFLWDRLLCICPQYNTNNDEIRSGSTVTYRDMVGSGTTQLDFLLSICKPFGLIIEKGINSEKNNIYIRTRDVHFANYEIIDWTYKLDYSKGYQKTVIPFDYKYAVLKWKDGDGFYDEFYREKYNREYGQLRANTGYEFEDNERELINDNIFRNSIESLEQDSYYNRWTTFQGKTYSYNIAGNLISNFKTSNRTRENYKMGFTLGMYDGTKNTLAGNESVQFIISDDNDTLASQGTYCWEYDDGNVEPWQEGANTVVPNNRSPFQNSIPSIIRRSREYSLDFAVPAEDFTNRSNYDPNTTIYNRFWKYYLEERLNVNNHILNAYFYLTDNDVSQWDFTKFVTIENVLYFVNKIYDFDVNNYNTTKCELIRVTDINRYLSLFDCSLSTNRQGQGNILNISASNPTNNGTVIYSNVPPEIDLDSNWMSIVIYPRWFDIYNGYYFETSYTSNTTTNERISTAKISNGCNEIEFTFIQAGLTPDNTSIRIVRVDSSSTSISNSGAQPQFIIESGTYPVTLETSGAFGNKLSHTTVNNNTTIVTKTIIENTRDRNLELYLKADNGYNTYQFNMIQGAGTISLSPERITLNDNGDEIPINLSSSADLNNLVIQFLEAGTFNEITWLKARWYSWPSNVYFIYADKNTLSTERKGEVWFRVGNTTRILSVTQMSASEISLSHTYLEFASDGQITNANDGRNVITVTSNTTWNISDIPSWVHCSRTTGNSGDTVTITCDDNVWSDSNSNASFRSGTILFTSGTSKYIFNISQVCDYYTNAELNVWSTSHANTSDIHLSGGGMVIYDVYLSGVSGGLLHATYHLHPYTIAGGIDYTKEIDYGHIMRGGVDGYTERGVTVRINPPALGTPTRRCVFVAKYYDKQAQGWIIEG